MGWVMTIVNFFSGFLKGKNLWLLMILVLFFGIFGFGFTKLNKLKANVDILKKEAYIANLEKTICDEKLQKQNRAIEKYKQKIKLKPIKQKVKTKYKYIEIKDDTCKEQLDAYKELFYSFND